LRDAGAANRRGRKIRAKSARFDAAPPRCRDPGLEIPPSPACFGYHDRLQMNARLLVVVVAAGCAAHQHTEAPAPVEKPPITVAVIGFAGSDSVQSEAEGGCVMAVLEAGLRVVDRKQVVAALPDENDVDYAKLGRQLKADLIVDGGVVRGSRRLAAKLTARLISSHSANVLGTAVSKGRVRLGRQIGQQLCADLLAQLP
jgi:TolB-like protein